MSTYKDKKWYPYRFKTKEEFIKEYGIGWRVAAGRARLAFIEDMDYLLGQPYPYFIELNTISDNQYLTIPFDGDRQWIVLKFMLTSNKPLTPNYKSRKIERVL